VNSAWRGKANMMTMSWHMVMDFGPPLIGCYTGAFLFSPGVGAHPGRRAKRLFR
jgi:flavin reductase (DIM6/NTAB) family NADH-FMN oxidoreductase RutF